MNKELDKSIEIKLAEIALEHSYAYGREWDSSAKDLEQQLNKIGINNIKLFHKYKMPDNVTQADYMKKIALYGFFADFEMLNADDRWGFQTEFKNYIPDEKTRLHVIDYIKSKSKSYDEKLSDEYENIIKLNPELPNVQNKRNDVLYGAIFGFAPEEIEYYCRGRFQQGINIDAALDREQELSDKIKGYGIRVGYVLAPETAKKIISVLEKKKQSVIMDKDGREIK
jgi:hypothetical protein